MLVMVRLLLKRETHSKKQKLFIGNFHLIVCLDPNSKKEKEAVERVYDRLIFRALKVQGTCTGEHGIGLGLLYETETNNIVIYIFYIGKINFLLHELGCDAVLVMRTIKEAIDPKNIMNPYKLLPSRKEIDEFRAQYEQVSKL